MTDSWSQNQVANAMHLYQGATKKFVLKYKDTSKRDCVIHAARYVREGDEAKFYGNGPHAFATVDMTMVDRIEEPSDEPG